MELQNITKERENDGYEGMSEPVLEVKTEGDAEPDHYAKLQKPAEDIYSEAFHAGPLVKTGADQETKGKTRLYQAACLCLTIICLVLLLVVIILSVKLQNNSTVGVERGEVTQEECLALCPDTQPKVQTNPTVCPVRGRVTQQECRALYPNIQDLSCLQCPDGWLTFDQACFFLSTTRLSWDESRNNCSSRGGDLAVVTSRNVQNFLTGKGQLNYWIGLSQTEGRWSWVNKRVLQQSYWKDGSAEGDCGILSSRDPPGKNWMRASCDADTYFICQLQLRKSF